MKQQNLDESIERNRLEWINNLRRDGNDGYYWVVTDSELQKINRIAEARGIDPWKGMAWVTILEEIQRGQDE